MKEYEKLIQRFSALLLNGKVSKEDLERLKKQLEELERAK